jgi:hypothetical protein
VSANVPTALFEPVVTWRVVLPDAVTVLGVKLALAPLGRPDAENETAPTNPPTAETETAYDVLLPFLTVRELGLTASAKSGGGGGASTIRVTITERVRAPLDPAMRSG